MKRIKPAGTPQPPNSPIPVLHHTGIADARSDSNKKAGFGYR